MCNVLMVLEVVLVVLEVVLVVLEVTGPQVPWGVYQMRMSLRPGLYSPALPIRISVCWDFGPLKVGSIPYRLGRY